jgi:predicted DNA binding CopG/RHH family protein
VPATPGDGPPLMIPGNDHGSTRMNSATTRTSVERGDWKRPTTTAKDMARLQAAARAIVRKDKRVNIRITARDLTHLQKAAVEEGIPYQTFISSILHKYITGRLVERLVAVAQPTKIILFGSQARGDADDLSDVDLLVIKPHIADRYEEIIELDRSLAGILIPVDILLVSESEFEERADQPGTVERAARQEGRVLYAA